MTRLLLVVLFLTAGCSLGPKAVDINASKLDDEIATADDSKIPHPTKTIDSIIADVITKRGNIFETTNLNPSTLVQNGFIAERVLRDTISDPNIDLIILTYDNFKSSIEMFRNEINHQACCVSDEDIIRLKNYNDLEAFKNGASKIILINNSVIIIHSGDRIEDNNDFNQFLDSYLIGRNFKKLEIGYGGPAKWTRR